MARIIAYKIIAKDKFSGVARSVSKATSKLRMRFEMLAQAVGISNGSFKDFGDTLKKIGRFMTAGSVAVVGMGTKSILVSGQMESLRMSLEGITGSAEEGEAVFNSLLKFAAKTPFQIQGLGEATKQLIASKIATKDLIPTMTLLGDIASISGGDVKGLARVYTQINAMPKLKMQDVHQLSARGIPLVAEIAKMLSSQGMGEVSIGDVTEAIGQGKISNKIALKVLAAMNQEGGVAYKAMEIQSGTIPGLWSNIADEMSQTWQIIGDMVGEFIGIKDWLQSIITWLGKFRVFLNYMHKEHPVLTNLVLTFIVFLSILGPILAVFGGLIAKMILSYAALNYFLGAATASVVRMKVLNAVLGISKIIFSMVALKIALIVGAVFLLLGVLALLYLNWDKIVSFMESSIANLVASFNFLKDQAYEALHSGLSGKVLEFIGKISGDNDKTAQLDVNLNDPGNNVNSISTSYTGFTGLQVGYGMDGKL